MRNLQAWVKLTSLTVGFVLTAAGQVPPRKGADASVSRQQAGPLTDGEPLAMVGGQPIRERDLADSLAGQMLQIRNQEYQAKIRALEEVIRQKALNVEASKRGVTVEQLLAQEVDSRIPAPTAGEAAVYYLAVKSQYNRPFAEIEDQLKASIRALQIREYRQEYANWLRSQADVKILLRAPKMEVSYDASQVRGDANAPVTIVEFADYQCPYCRTTEATVRRLLEKYPGQIKVAFRDFPLASIHPNAQAASEAARCGGKQGKFWEFHDALFGDRANLDPSGLNEVAKKLGLDEKRFQACLASGETRAEIAKDLEDGTRAGVSGTPAFFVGGVFLNGAQPEAEFERLIRDELTDLKTRTAAGNSAPR